MKGVWEWKGQICVLYDTTMHGTGERTITSVHSSRTSPRCGTPWCLTDSGGVKVPVEGVGILVWGTPRTGISWFRDSGRADLRSRYKIRPYPGGVTPVD